MVEERLANFVNVIPSMVTLYREKDNPDIEMDAETMLMAKIRTKQATSIIDFVTKQHPYDVAEIYTVPVSGRSQVLILD